MQTALNAKKILIFYSSNRYFIDTKQSSLGDCIIFARWNDTTECLLTGYIYYFSLQHFLPAPALHQRNQTAI